MAEPARTSSYPYVIVRVTCTKCTRRGNYRLARLAERFGAEASLVDVLRALSRDCANHGFKREKGSYPQPCGAVLADLGTPRPPDVPPERPPPGAPVMMRPRLVGGRG